MASPERGRFDSLVGRLFRPSTTSDVSVEEEAAAAVSNRTSGVREKIPIQVIDAGSTVTDSIAGGEATQQVEPDSAELYRHTFGRSRGSSVGRESPSTAAALGTTSTKGKERAVEEPTERKISAEAGDRETYTTPLTPRMQERERRAAAAQGEILSDVRSKRRSRGADVESPDLGREEGTAGRRAIKTLQRSRSTSLDGLLNPVDDTLKGYRGVERALEAQKQQSGQGDDAFVVPPRRSSQLSTPVPPLILEPVKEPEPPLSRASKRVSPSFALGLTSKGVRLTNMEDISPRTRKGNVAFRHRALSEPSSSYDPALLKSATAPTYVDHPRRVSEEAGRRHLRQQQAAAARSPSATRDSPENVYRPVRTRPLSLPAWDLPKQATGDTRAAHGHASVDFGSPIVMPWDPAQSTMLSLRQAMGDGVTGKISQDQYPDRSSLNLLLHRRAQARYHLSALSALRTRLPAPSSNELAPIIYTSLLARTHHTLLFVLTYAHVISTLFLDYNTVYSIVLVAGNPDPSASSAAWWIATGIYGAALLAWFVGVVIIWETVYQYQRRWLNTRPFALPIYLSSAAFQLTSVRSMALYSLLYRARLSADRRDFIIETFWFYSQNWPTVLTLIPRGIILVVFLVLYSPNSSSNRVAPASPRDVTYFDQTTGLLTNFSFIVLIINASWMAWRLLVLLISYAGLFTTLGPGALYEREKSLYEWQDSDSMLIPLAQNIPPSQASVRRQGLSMDGELRLSHAREDRQSSVSLDVPRIMLREEQVTTPTSASRQGTPGERTSFAQQLQQQQQLLQPLQPAAAISIQSVQLPRWAWRGRAEERIKALLLQSNCFSESNRHLLVSSSTAAWPPLSPGMGGMAEQQRSGSIDRRAAASNLGPEMRTRYSSSASYLPGRTQAGGFTAAHRTHPGDESLDYPPEADLSTSSEQRLMIGQDIPVAVAAAETGALTPVQGSPHSRVSASSQIASSANRRDQSSNSSGFSPRGDASQRASGATFSASSKATVGQDVEGWSGSEGRKEEGIVDEQYLSTTFPFPTRSGELTPQAEVKLPYETRSAADLIADEAQLEGRRRSPTSSPTKALPIAVDAVASVPSKRGRASSSLSSLAESLRFGRSNKSVDKIEGSSVTDLQSGSSTKDQRGASSSTVRGEGTWWSNLMRSRPADTNGSKEVISSSPPTGLAIVPVEKAEQSEQVVQEQEQPKHPHVADAEEVTPIEEEQLSQQTHETSSTEDSEERRLWAQFPEQSRANPPGLIALQLEQKAEERRFSAEEARQSSSPQYETEADRSGTGSSPRRSGEGLLPIKEESWTSSLDSISNESH